MRRGIFITGVALVAIGAIIALVGVFVLSVSIAIPASGTGSSGSFYTYTPQMVGSGTVTVAWAGAPSGFRLSIDQCSDASCRSVSSVVANGQGSSGTLSFAANGGTTYLADPHNTNPNAVPTTWQVTGLTYLALVGVVVAVLGTVLAFFGYRMKPRPRPVADASAAPEQREMFSTKPFKDLEVGAASQFVGEHSERARANAPQPSGPVYFKPSEPEELYGAGDTPAPAPAKGARPPVKCSYCGAMNEPWIVNCRNCRRPMTSTGG